MQTENLKKRILFVCYVLCLLALGYVVLRILAYIGTAVLLLAGSVLVAYLIKPIVSFFSKPVTLRIPRRFFLSRSGWGDPANFWKVPLLRRGLPWVASIILVYVLLICVIVLVVSFVVPLVVREFQNFLNYGVAVLDAKLRANIDEFRVWLYAHLPPEAAEILPDYLNLTRAGAAVSEWAVGSLKAVPQMMGRLVGMIVMAFIIPVLTFYLLVDIDRLREGFLVLFPRERRADVKDLIDKIDDVLARYIRGQIAVACIIGVSISIVLKVLGLPYAVLIGIFAGFINLIPYVGTPLGMIPAFLVAVFMPEHGGLLKGLIVLLSMYCIHITEGKVIVPTVVGKSVGLPPILIIFSLIVGAELLGLAGMLLAVPFASIVRVLVDHFIEKRDRLEGTQPHHFVHGRGPTTAA